MDSNDGTGEGIMPLPDDFLKSLNGDHLTVSSIKYAR